MSRDVINMFDEHLSWVNLWCRNKYSNRVIKKYHENLQNALNVRLLSSVISLYYKVPSGRKGKKKACGISIHSRIIVESIKNDFRILSVLISNNPFFSGNEPTVHDVQAFSNLAQLRLIYKEIQHPLSNTFNDSGLYVSCVVSHAEEHQVQDCADICATLNLWAYVPACAQQSTHKESDEKQLVELENIKEYDNEIETEIEKATVENNEKGDEKEK